MTNRRPPGPSSPLAGLRLLAGGPETLDYLTGLARTYGDAVQLRVGPRRVFLFNHPDAIHDVLVVKERAFRKGLALQRARELLGAGLLTSEGAAHLERRRMMQPAFHRQRIAGYAATILDSAGSVSNGWQDGVPVDVAEEMNALTLDIVSRVLFGYDVGDEARGVRGAMNDLMDVFLRMVTPLWPILRRLPLPRSRRADRAIRRLDEIVGRIITSRRETQEADRGDLLSMLLLARDDAGGALSDREVRDEVMTLFLAGHETTANALAWAWYLLAMNPEAADGIRVEAELVAPGRALRAEDYPRLAHTSRVFHEVLRLYPPAWIVGRQALEDVEIAGYTVPRGSIVVVSQWVVHRDPRFYPAPLAFDPLRWTDQAKAARPRFSFFPFGGGSRMCIGDSFALCEGVLVLAEIARRWRMEPVTHSHPAMQPSITLRPRGGIQLKLRRRDAHEETAVA